MSIRLDATPLIALLAAALAAPLHAQTAMPTSAEIVARSVKVVDPTGSLAKHKSSHTLGTIEVVGMGVTGTVEGYAALPSRVYTKMSLGPIGSVETGYDGTVGWIINPAIGPTLMDTLQLSRLRQLNSFDYWQFKPGSFKSMSEPTKVVFEGKPSYKISFVALDGWPYDEYFDVETGFRRGVQFIDRSNGQSGPVTIVLDDYRPNGDAMLAVTVTQKTPVATLVQRVTKVEFDMTPDSVFALPAAIKAIVK